MLAHNLKKSLSIGADGMIITFQMESQRTFSPQPLGINVRNLKLDGLSLTETKYSASLALPRHIHECACITIVLKGGYSESFGRHIEECRPYSMMLKPPGEDHSNQYGKTGAQSLVIEIAPKKLKAISTLSKIFDQVIHARGGVGTALAMRIYKEFRIRDNASSLSIEGLVFEILAFSNRNKSNKFASTPPLWLQKAKDIIHDHFKNPLTLARLAILVGVDPSYLAKMFRKHYRCTMGEYVRRVRLDKAILQMDGNRPLSEVALDLGFYDQSHFTNSFKSYYGVTPAEFRSEIRANR